MKLLRRCFAPRVVVCLIYRKSALLLGRLLVALPGAGFVAEGIIVCWGCPGRAMRDSSSGVERLRIPRGRKSESAVVLVFVVPVILTSLVNHGIISDLSVPVSFVGVTHYGDLRANFNQGCPNVRRLPRSYCRKLQPGMP
ncbi:hypothetical protein CDL15_Pgr008286 [Punica granatum]|uniref:Uncharacterized protein n=1 Tax=Punica granatum TaxID=22663 RepID=A0A218W5P0_PUNGR|nr:hypothetical protein CDL15_Pgr008286 [Punica granatum]